MSMTYKDSGVDYGAMDPFKRACQMRAALTATNVNRFGLKSLEWTRGESVHVMWEQTANRTHKHLGHVEEGLGTKSLVADAMYKLMGKSYYDQIAQDTVAMIVNDMVTLGILPVGVAMHLAVGESEWFDDVERSQDLVNGWGDSCNLARCVWTGGETPTLKGLVMPGTALLSGSAYGIACGHKLMDSSNIRHGDMIIFLESSGIHANGPTLARKIAERKDGFWRKFGHFFVPSRFPLQELPDGYMTVLPTGRTYGEALLDPTHIYVGFVEDCLNAGVDIHYAVNITGHGWRKLMRATQPFTYVIDKLPEQHAVLDFIQKHGPVETSEMFGNYNMGAGFALYVPEAGVEKVLELGREPKYGFRAVLSGYIEDGEKRVMINPVGLEFAADTLAVR